MIDRLVAAFGPELAILQEVPADDLGVIGGSTLTEAMIRLRRGEVIKEAGYDGEYGRVRLFEPGELEHGDALFDLPASVPATGKADAAGREKVARRAAAADNGGGTLAGPGGGRLAGPGGPGVIAGARDGAPRLDRSNDRLRAGAADGALLGSLDEEQRAAARAGGPLMIIAGPGTGKTRTLTHRIAWQISERGIPPHRFLALTFTRRAAGEMQHRLAVLVRRGDDGPAADVLVTTFHGLALRLLGEYRDKAGLPPGFRMADETARLEAAANVAGSERDGRRLIAALGTGHRRDDRTLAGDRAALRADLAARGLVDVDDLIGRAARLLRDEPAVTAALRDRWPRISVDEYQDLDEEQHVLLRQLAGEGAGLTVIGDPDQAIYGFRGADVGFFLRFSADYPAAQTAFLTRNYRSGPAIVRAALQAIAPATLVPGRRLDAVSRPGAAPGAEQGTSGAAIASGRSGSPGRSRPAGPGIVFHEAASEQAEGSWIAGEIDRLIGGSSFHSLDSGRVDARQRHAALALSDIAVLYRTDAQATSLVQALTRAGLPFQKRSHDRLSRRPGVRDIVREIRLAEPGTDDDAGTAAGQEVSRRLRAAVRRLTALMPGSAPSAVDILAAGEVLAPLASRCGDNVEQFLTEISLGGEADAIDPRADAVSLLTLHAAKGLEFAVVFIAGCERGLLPLCRPGAVPAPRPGQPEGGPAVDVAEERRLLFVGMTRARTRLFLTCAGHRGRVMPGEPQVPGGRAEAGPSPFLADIDPVLLSRVASPRRPQPDRQLRLL